MPFRANSHQLLVVSFQMIPKAITLDLIQSSPNLFECIKLYVNEHRHRVDGSLPAHFPTSLKQMALVVDLDNSIRSSGLWGYLGDITSNDGNISEVTEIISALHRYQAPRVASILEEAIEVWKEFLSLYCPLFQQSNKASHDDFKKARELRDNMERQLEPLDLEYYQAQDELARLLSDYVRAHPDDFLNPEPVP